MKLKVKFFIAFIITSLLILFLVTGVTQLTIRKNFIQFVNKTEFEKLTKMVTLLKISYQKNNGWDGLRDKPDAWDILFFQSNPDNPGLVPDPSKLRDHLRHVNKRPPKIKMLPEPPKPMEPRSLHRRLCLFDADKQYVAGEFQINDKFDYHPIVLSSQTTKQPLRKTIGWLGFKNQSDMISPLGLEFLKNQTNSFYIIGIGIFILALMISYIMSKMLLAPIRELAVGTQAIRNLDFNTTLEVKSTDELGRLAQDFNLMIQTLKQSETMRKNWISDISHELRTPVAVIRSKIEALQDGVRVMTPQLLDSLHKDILGLGELVNDLHLISLADSKNLNMSQTTVSPLDLVSQSLESFFIRLEKKSIKVKTDWTETKQIKIMGDALQLTRVFHNLLENSIRYTQSPGRLEISHTIKDDIKKKWLILNFDDSSPGVPRDKLEFIFNRLYRVEQSRNRTLGGSGLGLSIARQIITSHNGTIEASVSSLGGLKIQIKLPLNES